MVEGNLSAAHDNECTQWRIVPSDIDPWGKLASNASGHPWPLCLLGKFAVDSFWWSAKDYSERLQRLLLTFDLLKGNSYEYKRRHSYLSPDGGQKIKDGASRFSVYSLCGAQFV